jgi:predicted metal-dependent HD superfamily phosphohydrolase
MNLPIIQDAENFVRTLLRTRLDIRFSYHNVQHTERVVEHAGFLALKEGLSREDTEMLMLAAWFHDTGFTSCYAGHEHESVRIASTFLQSEGYSEERISVVKKCILSTQKNVMPDGLLECILHDADYYHLFLNDYFRSVENLRRELADIARVQFSDAQWWNMNGRFLACQEFYTHSDKTLWANRKEKLLEENERLLVSAHQP